MRGSIICPKCHGNGFIYSFNHDDRKKEAIDCGYCNNQGEVDITEEVMKDLEETKGVN
jgi:Zn ribbon nucleic-acid-binding protein